jgi:poly(A) polymerase
MTERPDDRLSAFHRRVNDDPQFRFLQELVAEFPEAEAYVVGGIVRDVLLGREAKDYDFVIRGVPADALRTFLGKRGSVDLVGRNFGVFKFVPAGWPEGAEPLDIALPRTEHAEGTGGSRDFDVQADPALGIEADLSRRDFTINAMAWDLRQGRLVDPHGGRQDLEARRIRAVGNATERFTEDRSRMLRGLRFAAQLGFDIEPETFAAIRAHMLTINEERAARKVHEHTSLIADEEFITPREVIARELIKSFVADPVRSLDLWDESGAIEQLMPELLAMKGCAQPGEYHAEGDVWTHTRLALSALRSERYRQEFGDERPSALVMLGALFHDIAKPPTQKTPERDRTDRIRFDGHDTLGGTMARAIARRLALSAPFEKGHPLHVDPADLGWVIDHHLLLINDPAAMRPGTLERYFFNPDKPGDALLAVMFCDGSASLAPSEEVAELAHFRQLRERIAELRRFIDERNRLPKPVLNGNDIMTRFGLTPGPRIGELIAALREEQLTRLQAGQTMTADDAYTFLGQRLKEG